MEKQHQTLRRGPLGSRRSYLVFCHPTPQGFLDGALAWSPEVYIHRGAVQNLLWRRGRHDWKCQLRK